MKIEIDGKAIRNNINAPRAVLQPILQVGAVSGSGPAMQAQVWGRTVLLDGKSPYLHVDGVIKKHMHNRCIVAEDATMIIHVNMAFVKANRKDDKRRPVFTIKHKGKTRYASEVRIATECQVVYNGKQLSCGARVWVQANPGYVELINEMSYTEARCFGEIK